MDSGRRISEKVRELTTTPMETDTKANGTTICRMEMEPTITQTETSTKDSGSMEDNMVKATTSMYLIKASTKANGVMAKNKVSVS